MIATETAYAKINLALHVRRRRGDGYHEIETVFAFCEDGDRVEAEAADVLSLKLEGPFADELCTGKASGVAPNTSVAPDLIRGRAFSFSNFAQEEALARIKSRPTGLDFDDNLVLRAAHALGVSASLRLTKNLPIASGIGGGSADAAATLRLLGEGRDLYDIATQLGADVPACIASVTARGDGTGTDLMPVDAGVGGMPVLLVNPRVALSTAAVFKAWDGVDRGPLDDWRAGRNDLETPARALVPQIAHVIDWLAAQPGASFARMSGSGATCFALFDDESARDAASAKVPEIWWSLASRLR